MLELLTQILWAMTSWCPRLCIVRSTHQLAKFRGGKDLRICPAGLWWYWPLVTEVDLVPIVCQSMITATQYLHTRDSKTIGVSALVVYHVDDPRLLYERYATPEDAIGDIVQGAVKCVVVSSDFDTLSTAAADANLREEVRKKLRPCGIKVKEATLTSVSHCRVHGIWGIEK